MSAPLPIIPKPPDKSFDGLLNELLFEQADLSAVEAFSRWHDADHASAVSLHRPSRAPSYAALLPASAPKPGEQYAFEVDLDACSGCKACVVACHNLNNLEKEETWRKVGWLTSHDAELPIVQHVTTACHHCVDPGCLNGCPVKAYEKDPLTGIVKHLDDQCFGCKYCTMMCPYEVPQYSKTLGIVRKCDMCHQRLANDEAPACVQACPNQAIRIRIVNSAEVRASIALTEAALLPTAPPSSITLPTTTFVGKRPLPLNVVSSESVGDHPHEGHLPLVGMLVLTQAGVGLWSTTALAMILSMVSSSNHDWAAARIDSVFEKPLTDNLFWEKPGERGQESFVPTALIATALGVVGVHLALLHLGRPRLAYRAFLGWRTSWLSREAIAFGIYMAATGLATPAVFLSGQIGFRSTVVISSLAAVVGLVAVFCSAMIYVATGRPQWNGVRTIGGFMLTSLALGLALMGATSHAMEPSVAVLMGASFSLLAFVPQWSDVVRYQRTLTPDTSPVETREGRQEPLPPVDARTRNAGFSARSGGVIIRRLSTAWLAMWFGWATAIVVGTVGLLADVDPGFFYAMAVVGLFVAHLLHRWIYFSAIVTHRMPGAGT